MESHAQTLADKIFFDHFQFFPSAAWPFCFLYFCTVYANVQFKRALLFWFPVSIGPVLVVAFVALEKWHNQIYYDAAVVNGQLEYSFPGILYFGFAVTLLLLAIGIGFLLSGIRRAAPLFRKQRRIVLGGSLVPLVGVCLSIADIHIAGHRDTSIFTFAISNLVVAYALFKEHLLEVVPVARDKIVDVMHDFAVVVSNDGAVLDLNLPAQKLLKLSGSKWVGKNYKTVFFQWPEFSDAVNASFREEQGQEEKGERVVTHGSGRHFEVSQNVLITRGRQTGYVYLGHDITAAVEQELLLEAAVRARTEDLSVANTINIKMQERLKGILGKLPFALVGIDLDHRVIYWNELAAGETGIDCDEAHGVLIADVWKRFPQDVASLKRAVEGGEYTSYRDTLEKRHYSVVVFPVVDGAVLMREDISTEVKFQETLAQSEKMVAVGGLAAGMAHEINNPLAGMMQCAQVLNERLCKVSARNAAAAKKCGIEFEQILTYMEQRNVLSLLQQLGDSGTRLTSIVSNMLTLAKKDDNVYEPTNIAELIDDTLQIASAEFNLAQSYDFKKIAVHKEFVSSCRWPRCHRSKLQQVFLNLFKNSADALLAVADTRTPRLTIGIREQEDWFVIDVKDNGPGIPEGIEKRIFEPFFTTKEGNRGTGLGLSIGFFIITHTHRGTLSVQSSDAGTCFTIKLPL